MDAKPAGADKTHEEVENAVTFAAGPQIEAADEISAVKETPVDLIKKINHGVVFTFEEEKAVLRKIDLRILPLILFAYFLQQLDKSSLSYASVFNIQRDAGLVGLQYSWLGSSLYLAQLVMQPLGAVLLVKYPTGKVISIAIFFWSVCLMGMVGCKNFGSLLAARVLLGSFESLIAPSLIAVTQMWWRRSEQTNRIMAWNAMNGVTVIVGSLSTYGLGHIYSETLFSYQIIFLFCACLTLVFSVVAFIFMPDSPMEAKFLKGHQRDIAIERLRANQMGIITREWRWDHLKEALLDLKTYCWAVIIVCISIPSGGITTFGPLIIKTFGFDQFTTILFNTPFGGVQFIVIIVSGIVATKVRMRGPIIIALTIPAIIGSIILLKVDRSRSGILLFGYYLLSFYPAITPMIFSWSSQNTAGDTKRKVTTAFMFVALCTGNVIGPLLYSSEDAPLYTKGLVANLTMFCAIAVIAMCIMLYLKFLNQKHSQMRVAVGKPAVIVDLSMMGKKEISEMDKTQTEIPEDLGEDAFMDQTDLKNEDFIYIL